MKFVDTTAQLPRMKDLCILAMQFHVCLAALRDRVSPLNRLDEKREVYNLNSVQRYGSMCVRNIAIISSKLVC